MVADPNHYRRERDFPTFRESNQVVGFRGDLLSVKFSPYHAPEEDPVFAFVGGQHVFICKPPSAENGTSKIEYIEYFFDNDATEDFYTCAWSKDLDDDTPLICVAGLNSKIKIINALTGELQRTLTGHGGEIWDLAVSPTNPYILASASKDSTIRIWSLDPEHAENPCVAILGGEGHRAIVSSIAFHSSGRYLLSGGHDYVINLWTIPDFPDGNTGTPRPTQIFYPHFSSSEVIENIIDCVQFYGDLILSRSYDSEIVLWSINGFSSSNPAPSPLTAPTTHDSARNTRSAFTSVLRNDTEAKSDTLYFTRLMQFYTPKSGIIFMRFGLFPGSEDGGRPLLAFCNTVGRVLFWDLDRFVEYYDWAATDPPELLDDDSSSNAQSQNANSASPTKAQVINQSYNQNHSRPPFLQPVTRRVRGGGALSRIARHATPGESTGSGNTGSDELAVDEAANGKGKVDWEKTKTRWIAKYEIGSPMEEVEAHKEEVFDNLNFTGREIAFSGNGQWMVIVGSSGVVVLMQRWRR